MTIKQSKPQKKRGRKPKGGKIIDINDIPVQSSDQTMPNIILHLQCFIDDLNQTKQCCNTVEAYNGGNSALDNTNLSYSSINQPSEKNTSIQPTPDKEKGLIERLEKLNKFLFHIQKNSGNFQNIIAHEMIEQMEQHSSCFWCTCDFDTPAIYIPKHEVNGKYEVYGCFCSPECGVAYLFEETIDQSVKWERYALLNYLYQNIFNQTKPFHPAPNPRYVLDKYFGTLTIHEYRDLLRSGQHMMIIDKPISKVYPEVHLDRHEFNELNHTGKRKMKLMAPRKVSQQNQQSKNNILQNTFGNS